MEGKEKMIQIYEVMTDITLNRLNAIKEAGGMPCEDTLEMVRATESLYNSISYANQPTVIPTSMLDVSGE